MPLVHRPADVITLVRAVLAVVVAVIGPTGPGLVLVVVALSLDWVDGQVARRTGTASAFGARFDMEADAFLIAVLSVYAAAGYGWWVRQNFSIRVVGERPLSAGLSRVSELLQEVCPDFWQDETISGQGGKGGTLPYR